MKTRVTMKPSGVAWLGDIPADWQQKRAKFLFFKSQQKPLESDEVVTAFRDGEVVLRSERRTDGFTFADKEIGYQHVEKGDLVIHAMDAFAGAIGVSKSSGKMSPVCSICKPLTQEVDTTYYSYLLRAMTKTNWLAAIAKGIRERSTDFRFGDFGSMLLPLPPLQTQKSIVAYVDKETAQIDMLIAKQQRMLNLLEEKRMSLVAHVTSRGLHDDAKLLENDSKWLSKLPGHWRTALIKHVAIMSGGGTPRKDSSDFWGGSIPWVSPKDMKSEHIKATRDHITDIGLKNSSVKLIKPGCLLIVVRSGILQRTIPVAINDVAVTLNQDLKALCFNEDVNVEYVRYLIFGNQRSLLPLWTKQGATVESIEIDYLRNTPIPIPPPKEQSEIVEYLNAELVILDNLKSKIYEQIDLLKERRTSLIASAVTGKVKV